MAYLFDIVAIKKEYSRRMTVPQEDMLRELETQPRWRVRTSFTPRGNDRLWQAMAAGWEGDPLTPPVLTQQRSM